MVGFQTELKFIKQDWNCELLKKNIVIAQDQLIKVVYSTSVPLIIMFVFCRVCCHSENIRHG